MLRRLQINKTGIEGDDGTSVEILINVVFEMFFDKLSHHT